MNLFTHLSLSIKLKRIIKKRYGIKLRPISFLLGSIKPDISSRYNSIPHTKKDSQGFFNKQIQDILESNLRESTKCTREFSQKLGVIIHYLSDFFCYAHSDEFKGGLWDHILYEIKLSFNKADFKEVSYLEDKDLFVNKNASEIINRINHLHKEYSYTESKMQMHADMAYAIKAGKFLCSSIVAICLESDFVDLTGDILLEKG